MRHANARIHRSTVSQKNHNDTHTHTPQNAENSPAAIPRRARDWRGFLRGLRRRGSLPRQMSTTHTPPAYYVPFGDEWKKEVSKIRKSAIVELYRAALVREMESNRASGMAYFKTFEEMAEWHPVAQPPDEETTVLVGFADGEVELGCLEAGDWRSFEGVIYPDAPIAWRELPEVPAHFLAVAEKGVAR